MDGEHIDYTLEPGRKINNTLYYGDDEPVISIITAYYNSKDYIMQTANSVLNQTFPFWEWIIVNDGSTEEGSEETLEKIVQLDSRIKVFKVENGGPALARDYGFKKAKADYVFVLDSDDLIDKTFLECGYWTLKTNPDAGWVYSNEIAFGNNQYTYSPIMNSKIEKKENLLCIASLIKKNLIFEVGGYASTQRTYHEDWKLWLRLLAKNYYPIKMNYYGFWYRIRGGMLQTALKHPEERAKALSIIEELGKDVKNEIEGINYPVTSNYFYDSFPMEFDWNKKPINVKGKKKRLLFIFPWLKFDESDNLNYELISKLDQNEYEITIITTEPSLYLGRQKFEEFAEIFDLTTFLHTENWVGFIQYIMKSRNIDFVMLVNSCYGFYSIPWLKSEFPDVVFSSCIYHDENFENNESFPKNSEPISNFLDKVFEKDKLNDVSEITTEIKSLINNGTKINKSILDNKELFGHYLVLHNENDKRKYNSATGGIVNKNRNIIKGSIWDTIDKLEKIIKDKDLLFDNETTRLIEENQQKEEKIIHIQQLYDERTEELNNVYNSKRWKIMSKILDRKKRN